MGYPNQKIVISTWREFIKVDFKTGKTLARDRVTNLDDLYEFGNEWQVLPSEPMLFHEVEQPQFPKKCVVPEDPMGARRRRLDEMTITEKQAEAACSHIKNALDRKDCVYDTIATQDLDMAGAY